VRGEPLLDIIRYRARESPVPLVGVREEGQVFGLPGVETLAALWALPLAEIRQRVRDRDVVAVAVAGVGVLTTGVVRGLDRMREAFGCSEALFTRS
jgi:hypothetical protein